MSSFFMNNFNLIYTLLSFWLSVLETPINRKKLASSAWKTSRSNYILWSSSGLVQPSSNGDLGLMGGIFSSIWRGSKCHEYSSSNNSSNSTAWSNMCHIPSWAMHVLKESDPSASDSKRLPMTHTEGCCNNRLPFDLFCNILYSQIGFPYIQHEHLNVQ